MSELRAHHPIFLQEETNTFSASAFVPGSETDRQLKSWFHFDQHLWLQHFFLKNVYSEEYETSKFYFKHDRPFWLRRGSGRRNSPRKYIMVWLIEGLWKMIIMIRFMEEKGGGGVLRLQYTPPSPFSSTCWILMHILCANFGKCRPVSPFDQYGTDMTAVSLSCLCIGERLV